MGNRVDADEVAPPFIADVDAHGRAYFEQLRRRLRWQLLVAYVTPLLLLSVFFHLQYTRTLRSSIENHLRSIAENRRNTVDLFLQERVANLRNAFLSETLALPAPSGAMDKMLEELQHESPTFVDLGLFGPDGTLIAYAGPYPFLVGRSYTGELWFQQLHQQEAGYFISDVYLGFRGQPHFVIAVRQPVAGDTWTLRASVDPKRFGDFVATSYLIEEGQALIVNAAGQRQTLSGEAEPETHSSFVPPRDAETRVDEIAAGGVLYLRAIAWLSETEWALVVRVPAANVYAPLTKARLTLVGIMLLTLAFILFMVRRSTRTLVGKLEATAAAKEDLRLQLFNAAKLASVGEMAAGVAHEINNPLAIVYEEAAMMSDILDPELGQKLDPDDFRERLGAIKDAAMRGRNITSKLLAFSRQHEPDPEPSDMNALVDRALAVKSVDFKVSNIEVVKELAAELPLVLVSRNQIDQVLLNLLNNAKDAISGSGRITVRTRAGGKWVEIDVEDSGHGMPPAVMERVFFPFFTTKGVGRGTGLGLSISYGIVKALGGRIEVNSEVGVGTTFTIMLPASAPQSTTDSRSQVA